MAQTDSPFKKEITVIGKHSMVYFIGQALSRAVGFFMIPVYTRFIAPSDYGIMELVGIIAGGLSILISMSVSDSLSRFYYAQREKSEQNIVVSTAIFGFAVCGIPVVMLFIYLDQFFSTLVLESTEYSLLFLIAFLTGWFGLLIDAGTSYLRICYYSKLFVITSTSQLASALCLNIYFVVFRQLGILGILYSNLITSAIFGLALSLGVIIAVKPHFSLTKFIQLVKFGLPLVPSRIGLSFGFLSNRFFLQRFATLSDLGLFSLGFNFAVIISRFINTPLNMFWGPRRLELLLSEEQNSQRIVARVCTYNVFLSIFAALILSVSIKDIIELIADPSYWGAHKIVPVIALTMVVAGLENHMNAGILISKRTSLISYFGVISLFVILAWNFFFIPVYGVWGAATANLAGNILRLILIYLTSQRLYPLPFELSRIMKLFLASFLMFAFAIVCPIKATPPLLGLLLKLIFVSLYPFLLYLLRFYDQGEILQFKKIISSLSRNTCNFFARH
jgi:O-antigen/teichoic acid export membrane protein